VVARGPGAVGCAHCTLIGADRACQICTRLVCEKCAADWVTCGEPSGRLVRLGLSARLRDVDPSGRLGLVSHWREPLRLFDLRRLRWIHGLRLPRGAYVWNRRFPPRLTSDGRAIYGAWSAGSGYERSDSRLFSGMHVEDLRTHKAFVVPSDTPEHGTAVTATRDWFYYVTDTQLVTVIAGRGTYSVAPLPRKVIQAVHLDAERSLLASASWSELAIHRIVGGKLELISHNKTAVNGHVRWIAVAGERLVAQVRTDGGAHQLEIHSLRSDYAIGPVVRTRSLGELHHAALSRDGRYLALAYDDRLEIDDLSSDRSTTYEEHSDRINLVRFVGDDHLLISADTDNRVVMRPRTQAGYARALITIDIPQEPVPLPS
jgi:hypothetical protein